MPRALVVLAPADCFNGLNANRRGFVMQQPPGNRVFQVLRKLICEIERQSATNFRRLVRGQRDQLQGGVCKT